MSYGVGVAFTDIKSQDGNKDNNRTDEMFQMMMPVGYETHGFEMISTPRLGYAYGHYTRDGYKGKNYDGKVEKRIFGVTNEVRYPINIFGWKVSPTAEFNAIGYHIKGHEEDEEFALNINKQNIWSVEGGVGFSLAKEIEFGPPKKSLPSNMGLSFKSRVYSENRVRYPLKRVDWDPKGERNPQNRGKSKYVRISWDEASRLIEQYKPLKLKWVAGNHSPQEKIKEIVKDVRYLAQKNKSCEPWLKLTDRYMKLIEDMPKGSRYGLMCTVDPYKYTYEDIFPLKIMQYEDMMVPVPANYRKMLTDMYGDFLAFPPEEDRYHIQFIYIDFGDGREYVIDPVKGSLGEGKPAYQYEQK